MNVKRLYAGLTGLVLAGGLAGGLAACGSAAAPVTVTATPTPTVTPTPIVASTSPQIIINNNNNAAAVPTQTVTVPAPGQHATSDGCPVGYVCMYTVAGWQNQLPEHEYFDYGYYNLSSEIGPRVIVNNQTDGATVAGYYHYGGIGWAWTLPAQQENEYDITPINSISLNP